MKKDIILNLQKTFPFKTIYSGKEVAKEHLEKLFNIKNIDLKNNDLIISIKSKTVLTASYIDGLISNENVDIETLESSIYIQEDNKAPILFKDVKAKILNSEYRTFVKRFACRKEVLDK